MDSTLITYSEYLISATCIKLSQAKFFVAECLQVGNMTKIFTFACMSKLYTFIRIPFTHIIKHCSTIGYFSSHRLIIPMLSIVKELLLIDNLKIGGKQNGKMQLLNG